MFKVILSLGIIGAVLVLSQALVKKKMIHGEVARKFVHITTGAFISSWGFFLSLRQIQVLSVVLLVGVIISKVFKIFIAVHGVTRKTWGEIFFAISIGVAGTLSPNKWVFMVAILHMSVADGLAAIAGTSKFAKDTGYNVFGQYKTLVGTLTFFSVSLVIMTGLAVINPTVMSGQVWLAVFSVPLLSVITENIAISGLDNLAVPLVVIGVFQVISHIH